MIHLNISGFTPEECYELMLVGLQERRAHIDSEIQDLKLRGASLMPGKWFHGMKQLPNMGNPPKPKRRMSKEGRKRIVAAQKKRWAAAKKVKKPTPKPTAKKVPVKKQAKPKP